MSYREKSKRQAPSQNEYYLILRHFYLRLFMYLMIPPLFLGAIFGLSAWALSNLPDRLNAQCTVLDQALGVRIISQTTRTNITRYYYTDDAGVNWHLAHTAEYGYQSARANCDSVTFDDNGVIHVILADGLLLTISEQQLPNARASSETIFRDR
ncbi:MAG: hypothetical protein ACFE0Q_06520 [Anaerolineae bacterium]